MQAEPAQQSCEADIHRDEPQPIAGGRHAQVVDAHDFLAVDVHDLLVEQFAVEQQLVVGGALVFGVVRGPIEDDRPVVQRADRVERRVAHDAVAAFDVEARDRREALAAVDDHVGELADGHGRIVGP